MVVVNTRDLKQNPAVVIRQVLETGQSAAITAYGKPTGVVLMPESAARRHRWVPGSVLVESVSDLDDTQGRAWLDDLAASRDGAFGRDLWAAEA